MTSEAAAIPATAPDERRRWSIVTILSVCVLTPFMDVTMISVGLAEIARDLHAGLGELQWVIVAYMATSACLMPAMSAVGGRWGHRRTLLAGLALFGGASVAAAWAPGMGALIAARVVMGVGAAVVLPMRVAITSGLFPPAERRRAFGFGTAMVAVAMPFGPILGGALLEGFWWGSLFLINAGLVAVVLPLIVWLVPESRSAHAAPAGGGLAAAAAAGVRSPTFAWAQLTISSANLAWTGAMFVLPIYLQVVLGLTPLEVGLLLVPFAGLVAVGSLVSDRLSGRLGPRRVVVLGLLLLAAGIGLLSRVTPDTGYALIAAAMALGGLGGGVPQAPALAAAMSVMPPAAAGGGGLINALRHLGGAAGVLAVGLIVSSVYASRLPSLGALPPDSAGAARDSVVNVPAVIGDPALRDAAYTAFSDGVGRAMLCAALLLVAVAVLAAALPERPRRVAEDAR
ncbi:MFS transporter [Actinomadura sp. GTD37]|uniref:MFS transporter n=1 Tax=Actinomadura sp. GTD37 TaxID=1778030 RepID=UPI0035C252C5